MKNAKYLLPIFTLSLLFLIGCASNQVAVSFVENANENETATIIFMWGTEEDSSVVYSIRLVDFEGNLAPQPENLPRGGWVERAILPAGRPLDLRIYTITGPDKIGNRRRGIFKCPPLEAGKTYKLWYQVRTLYPKEKALINGKEYGTELLILTDASVKAINFNVNKSPIIKRFESMTARFKAITVQEIPTIQEYIQSHSSSGR